MKIRPHRPTFTLIYLHGQLCKIERCRTKTGKAYMRAPTRATIGDILDAADREGERPRDLLARLRGADRQWQLDHGWTRSGQRTKESF